MREALSCYYRSHGSMRSRSVGGGVLSGTVDIPALPAKLVADWEREIRHHLALEPGDVEELPLARARMRWPDYGRCVQAVSAWTHTLGLTGLLASSDMALMVCRGARYHHDGAQYGGSAFCNLFLGDDRGLDLHFPSTGQRIALGRGTVVIFDTCQPHAVIPRGASGFDAADFPVDLDCTLAFLTWELAIEHAGVAQALQIRFDTDPSTALLVSQEQVWRNGAPASVCPGSGRWIGPT
ncbi:hypothetical protein [Rhodoferax sp. AJA081-3]|uniref:hypothetical protein n=1 Tax=Rhodoferax sp. AJA081-3 TaxID=2752316 RepID=UPI003530490B